MTPKKAPVGTSECPIKKCEKSVDVFKYQSTSTDPGKRRFANRLYCVCPDHGRVENQEFLLEHMTWADGKKPAEKKPDDASPPVKASPSKIPPRTTMPSSQASPPVVTPVAPKPAPIKAQPWFLDFWSK